MKSSKCFGLYENNNIIGFIGVISHIGKVSAKKKRITRLVILPDYQGIGLGYKFLNFVAELYTVNGYELSICTSAKNLIYKLSSSNLWKCRSIGFSYNFCKGKKIYNKTKEVFKNRKNTARKNCKIASFVYLPKTT